MKGKLWNWVLSGLTAAWVGMSVLPLQAAADWQHIGCMGDLNADGGLTREDIVLMRNHLLGISGLTQENAYYVADRYIGIGGSDGFQVDGGYLTTGDVNQDGKVNAKDLTIMKRNAMMGDEPWVWQWSDETADFIDAPINDVKKYLPSQGEANLVIFYVDFPDCQYEFTPTAEQIEEIAFGAEDTTDTNYPFDSMSAFYGRSSKGAMQLQGRAFRYTAQNPVAAYNDVSGRIGLAKEIYQALDVEVDFSAFDGNGDGFIDATLVSVPKAAGDGNWWPCAGPVDDYNFTVDGMLIGHLITSNSQIGGPTDYYNFNSTVLHEMGHCMGLPDLYLYHGTDTEGMHGTAGSELMDVDATTDMSCVSKLQLGWYRENQIQVYDAATGTQSFTLANAQTDAGNVVLIPCGDLDARYHSEYMLIEYTTEDGNNSKPGWWQMMASGIRVYHVDATLYDNGWWVAYKYASGSEFTNNDAGRRLLRIIDDREVDNMYRTGDVVDGSIAGFHWYDENGNQTVETGLQIEIGELVDDQYTITISQK